MNVTEFLNNETARSQKLAAELKQHLAGRPAMEERFAAACNEWDSTATLALEESEMSKSEAADLMRREGPGDAKKAWFTGREGLSPKAGRRTG